jgi:predicted RNA-binding protein Jag
MENLEIFIKRLLELIGFNDYKIEIDEEHKHGLIFIYDQPALVKENLPNIVESLNHLLQLLAKKMDTPQIFFDVNNYRRERENLILELARAAARKVLATKEEISLPAMNSYERRLIHTELASNPEVITESTGIGRDRFIIIKIIKEV